MLRYAVALMVLASSAIIYALGASLIGTPPYERACICIGGAPAEDVYGLGWSVAILEPEDVGPAGIEVMGASTPVVLAYLNFGYAEEWRDYWDLVNSSGIVHGESPEYEGEYFVEYWSREWLNITSSLAMRYVSEGFDGVLLDNIDACEAVKGMPWAPPNPCAVMASSVSELVRRVREAYPDAEVFVNIGTAHELLANASFLNRIDGVLREEVWYVWASPCKSVPTRASEREEVLQYLDIAKAAGKTVLVADFVSDAVQAGTVCWEAWSRGYVPIPQPACDHDYTRPPSYGGCTILTVAASRALIRST